MKSGAVVYSSLAAALCIALVTCLAGALTHHHTISSGSVSLAVDKDGGNKSSPLLYGMMFEVRVFEDFLAAKLLITIYFRKWTIQVKSHDRQTPSQVVTMN